MTDTIEVFRPKPTADDATWNEDKNRWVEGGSHPQSIGTQLAFISSKGWNPRDQLAGGQQITVNTYQIATKLSDQVIMPDDIVRVVDCVRDPNLNGKELIVKAIVISSFATCRKILVEIWDGRRQR